MWGTYSDIEKQIKYHFHHNDDEKIHSDIDTAISTTINRRIFAQHGLPSFNTYLAGGSIFYKAIKNAELHYPRQDRWEIRMGANN